MSQVYQLKLKQSVSETRRLRDRVVHALTLTPILPAEEMLDLLRQELEADGFVTEGARCAREAEGGVRVSVDLEAREVEISLEREALVTSEVEGTDDYERDINGSRARAEERLSARLQSAARAKIDEDAKTHQAALTAELEERLEESQRLLNAPLQRVYAESLKRKARQLGEVVEVREGTEGGTYELFIKITQ